MVDQLHAAHVLHKPSERVANVVRELLESQGDYVDVVAMARRGATIEATILAYYVQKTTDEIHIPPGSEGSVVDRFLYVLCAYRSLHAAIASERDAAIAMRDTKIDECNRQYELCIERTRERDAAIRGREEAIEACGWMRTDAVAREDRIKNLNDLLGSAERERDELRGQIGSADNATEASRAATDELERVKAELEERDKAIPEREMFPVSIVDANGVTVLGLRDAEKLDLVLPVLRQMTEARDGTIADLERVKVELVDLAAEYSFACKEMVNLKSEIVTTEEACSRATDERDHLSDDCNGYRQQIMELEDTHETVKQAVAEVARPSPRQLARMEGYRALVVAVGRDPSKVPPSVKAAYLAAIRRQV